MKFHVIQDVRLSMPRAALMAIFDECDRYDHDETGGRVIGTFQEEGGKLALFVTGVIESGPRAQRTAVSFFQDGEHQEGVFREIELNHPEIEHLGNWHTHHVNGLSTLTAATSPPTGAQWTTRTTTHPSFTPFWSQIDATPQTRLSGMGSSTTYSVVTTNVLTRSRTSWSRSRTGTSSGL